MTTLRVGSLFTGLGLLDLGVEWALHDRGIACDHVYQVEIDPFCQHVLNLHYPHTKRFDDVVTATDLPRVDLLIGGFPCQNISVAGKREGIDGDRSGLWRHFARIIRETRPRFVVIENVARLVIAGLDRVVSDLDAAGYVTEGRIIAARDVGAPHKRERLFAVAYARDHGLQGLAPLDREDGGVEEQRRDDAARCGDRGFETFSDAFGNVVRIEPGRKRGQGGAARATGTRDDREAGRGGTEPGVGGLAHGSAGRLDRRAWMGWPAGRGERQKAWEPLRAQDEGVAHRRDRLRALGNGVVPACSYLAGARVADFIDAQR